LTNLNITLLILTVSARHRHVWSSTTLLYSSECRPNTVSYFKLSSNITLKMIDWFCTHLFLFFTILCIIDVWLGTMLMPKLFFDGGGDGSSFDLFYNWSKINVVTTRDLHNAVSQAKKHQQTKIKNIHFLALHFNFKQRTKD